ncbi:MAG: hypothetical protein GEU96_22565 [Propionibacteriales bacterium]|nr:hypothetical protein [Propionibacteriales bacterium]
MSLLPTHDTDVHWVSVLGHPSSVNAASTTGTMVGVFRDGQRVRGFRQDPDMTQSVIDAPGAVATFPQRVTESGDIAGDYTDPRGRQHGFVHRDGEYLPVDHPDAAHTWVTGINSRGDLTGCWQDRGGTMHGFVCRDGEYAPIDGTTHVLDLGEDGDVVALGRSTYGGKPPLLVGRPHRLRSAPEPTWDSTARQWSALAGSGPHLAGHYRHGTATHAMAFDGVRRQCVDLRFPGTRRSSATGVCADGSVVGYVIDVEGHRLGFVLPECLHS